MAPPSDQVITTRLVSIPAMVATVLTSLLLSGIGGGVGAYVALARVEERINALQGEFDGHLGAPHTDAERRLSRLEGRMEATLESINNRLGRMENRMDNSN